MQSPAAASQAFVAPEFCKKGGGLSSSLVNDDADER
jgi:hypothetical protein